MIHNLCEYNKDIFKEVIFQEMYILYCCSQEVIEEVLQETGKLT